MNGVSPWAAAATDIFNDQDLPHSYQKKVQDYNFTIHNVGDALYIIVTWPNGGRMALRAIYAPNDDMYIKRVVDKDDHVTFYIKSIMGDYTVSVQFPDANNVFRYTTTITPHAPLLMPFWPRDVIPLNKDGNDAQPQGEVYVNQFGTRTGLVYFSIKSPKTGSVLYMQNLTNLSDYCQETETSAADTVGGQWPELGFALPPTKNKPLPAGKAVIISDAFIALSADIPAGEFQMSKQFLDLLGAIYLRLPLPVTQYHNWPDILDKGLYDLENSHACWSHAGGQDYLNAYVSDYETPPEIMVQLAVLFPLFDYGVWSKRDIPAVKKILNGIGAFYDKEIGTVVRWHPAVVDNLDQSEEQLKPNVMDSWYLHHPMLNLGRMALRGETLAKKLFMDSLEYTIKVAHHFKYKWPVFYNMETLEVIKAEKEPGKGGEGDVAGLYAYVMLHAWDLTKNERYLAEAKYAAKTLSGLGFELFYQANNTAFAANAMLRLWKITKEKIYLDLSFLCLANIFKNFQLWDCNYGYAKNYTTFFALFPLSDAKYTAAYEEQEVFAALHDYLLFADDKDLPGSISLLLAEFTRYIVQRAAFYYPPNLPKEMLSDKVKMGQVDPKLWIALEDIHDGWEKSGEVGQEVYGAGVAFGIVPRHYLQVGDEPFLIFVDYPTIKYSKKGNSFSFDVRGDSRLTCRMVIVKKDKTKLPEFIVTQKGDGKRQELEGKLVKSNMEYRVNGNQKISVSWK